MKSHLVKGDPDLSRATKQRNWTLFFEAMQGAAPEIITRLNGKPFDAFRSLASRYKEVSSQTFGSIVSKVGGRPALTSLPFADLAKLVCVPDFQQTLTTWPPSAPFWDPALRAEVLALSIGMTEWGRNFRGVNGVLHWRVIDAGLETMRRWLQEPESAIHPYWYGLTEVIRSSVQLKPAEIKLSLSSWNPSNETEEQFKQRIKAVTDDLKRWAKDQIREVKQILVAFDTKRNPEHFSWAALRLVRELTYPQIANHWVTINPPSNGSIDEGTIRKGVQAVLKSLELRDLAAKRK